MQRPLYKVNCITCTTCWLLCHNPYGTRLNSYTIIPVCLFQVGLFRSSYAHVKQSSSIMYISLRFFFLNTNVSLPTFFSPDGPRFGLYVFWAPGFRKGLFHSLSYPNGTSHSENGASHLYESVVPHAGSLAVYVQWSIDGEVLDAGWQQWCSLNLNILGRPWGPLKSTILFLEQSYSLREVLYMFQEKNRWFQDRACKLQP